MVHVAFKEADVEPVETQPASRNPDRDVPGRTDHCAGYPGRKSKAFQRLRVVPDDQGILFPSTAGRWQTASFQLHDLSSVNVAKPTGVEQIFVGT